MLKAIEALEGLEPINLSLSFTDEKGNPITLTDNNGKSVIIEHLSEVYDNWKILSDKSKETVTLTV
jgi:hypothetical protein